jgi:hypothetical protein
VVLPKSIPIDLICTLLCMVMILRLAFLPN